MKLLSLSKKLFPYAFCIRTLHRFVWTLLCLCGAMTVTAVAFGLLLGHGALALVLALVFLLGTLYSAAGVTLCCLFFLEVIE